MYLHYVTFHILNALNNVDFGLILLKHSGRFDLRLPYAEQGWVDEEADGNPFSNFFGGGKPKKSVIASNENENEKLNPAKKEEPKKNGFWPF